MFNKGDIIEKSFEPDVKLRFPYSESYRLTVNTIVVKIHFER